MSLLEVRHLKTVFSTSRGAVRAVDDVSFTLDRGETLSLVGESGCGKSVTALSILRLISPPGRIAGGSMIFNGRNLLELSEAEMRRVRGNEIAMIFQDPMTSLNPVFTVGDQIAEAIRLHRRVSRREAWNQAIEGMRDVAIPAPEARARNYPHEMSGGMRQRIMIAMALACDPQLLIADEPTTALDVTIQAQILDLLAELRERRNLGLLLITHDLGVVAETSDRVAVMYAGQIIEHAPVTDLFNDPRHPYTEGLLRAVPRLGIAGGERRTRLETIEGVVPNPHEWPEGCRFAPRCRHAASYCLTGEMELYSFSPEHASRCVRAAELYVLKKK
ncbi:MAG: ABC transporter ATP-binding protein [Acidobacteria bacterium]|nr:ABC transporter ATP-binding protein [Acidobacteriota bacterium]MCW5968475.1 ABC transporter ATP-binding protein [Blastocatellales bacterium]